MVLQEIIFNFTSSQFWPFLNFSRSQKYPLPHLGSSHGPSYKWALTLLLYMPTYMYHRLGIYCKLLSVLLKLNFTSFDTFFLLTGGIEQSKLVSYIQMISWSLRSMATEYTFLVRCEPNCVNPIGNLRSHCYWVWFDLVAWPLVSMPSDFMPEIKLEFIIFYIDSMNCCKWVLYEKEHCPLYDSYQTSNKATMCSGNSAINLITCKHFLLHFFLKLSLTKRSNKR